MKKAFFQSAIAGGLLALASGACALTLDGLVSDLGTPYGTDPTSEGIQGPVDLDAIYVKEESGIVHFALTNPNAISGGNNWGKYLLWIDSKAGGATSDAWGRAVTFPSGFAPDYQISSWVDGSGGAELYSWTGTAWSQVDQDTAPSDFDNGFAFAISNVGPSGVEFQVTRAAIGNASAIELIGGTTGSGGSDNIQDAVGDSSQPNGNPNWSTPTPLSAPNSGNSTTFVPVAVSGFAID